MAAVELYLSRRKGLSGDGGLVDGFFFTIGICYIERMQRSWMALDWVPRFMLIAVHDDKSFLVLPRVCLLPVCCRVSSHSKLG